MTAIVITTTVEPGLGSVLNGTAAIPSSLYARRMVHQPDVTAQIRAFLMAHPGQHCEACLAKSAQLDPKAVKAVFKPSRDNPYSFMQTCCGDCEVTRLCVAYVGDRDTITGKQAAVALMGSKH